MSEIAEISKQPVANIAARSGVLIDNLEKVGDHEKPAGGGIVTNGLIFNIDANDINSYPGSGTTVYDTVETNDGTLTNGCAFGSSGGAKYFEFDGLDDFIELGSINSSNPLSLVGLNEMTLEVWVNPVGSGDSFQRIIDKSNGGSGANGWSLYYTNFQYLQFQINGGYPGLLNITPNVWQQFLVTVDLTTSTKEVNYFRNAGDTTSTYDQTGTVSTTTTGARIGSWNHSTGREFRGDIGIVRMYDKILSSVEIQANFDARKNFYGL